MNAKVLNCKIILSYWHWNDHTIYQIQACCSRLRVPLYFLLTKSLFCSDVFIACTFMAYCLYVVTFYEVLLWKSQVYTFTIYLWQHMSAKSFVGSEVNMKGHTVWYIMLFGIFSIEKKMKIFIKNHKI